MRRAFLWVGLGGVASCALVTDLDDLSGGRREGADGAPEADASRGDASPGPPGPIDASACVVAREPTCAPSTCARRILYTPSAKSFPFEIATDATSVYWTEIPVPDGGE